MKHLINILLILILTGFAVGTAYLSTHYNPKYAILFMADFILMIALGVKLDKDYE